jgi:U32 family peptidase
MKRTIELLAPGGDLDSIKAAIAAGANAVYCGLDRFNARNRAANISFEELNGVLRLAHAHDCLVYLTLNIIIVESDIPVLIPLLNKLVNTKIDGVIVQDFGVFLLLSKYFASLKVHASTQLTTHNEGQIRFLSKLGAVRVNLSRELSIAEVRDLTAAGHAANVSTEVFVHGSYCLSFSGICYLSSVNRQHSGNRGRCSQPCRDRYLTTPVGQDFPLNLKDNSAYDDLEMIADAGVDAIKVEGRMKKSHYVYTVTRCWQERLQAYYDPDKRAGDGGELLEVFNRGFSNSYMRGRIDREMYSEHPGNRSAEHLRKRNDDTEGQSKEPYDVIDENKAHVRRKIEQLRLPHVPLSLSVSGRVGRPMQVSVTTPDGSFAVHSEAHLVPQSSVGQPLNHALFLERLKAIDDTSFYIDHLELDGLQSNLHVPYRELTSIGRKILAILNDSPEPVDPVEVPIPKRRRDVVIRPTLSVLLSSREDLNLCSETSAALHFQLPSCLKHELHEYVELLVDNPGLVPWFPSVLIGDDYAAAVQLLRKVQPRPVVTNNTGIANEAHDAGIPWIAGPHLNVANSFSLVCLKELAGCHGAFISNELGKHQVRRIVSPEGFELHYSIYHPILLLSSRQCLFHQVTGCEKSEMDAACMSQCERSASITNLRNVSLHLRQSKGQYSSLYHEVHYLNTDIVADGPSTFSSFLIDLRDVETQTKVELGKPAVIELFERFLHGDVGAMRELKRRFHRTTSAQYEKGI